MDLLEEGKPIEGGAFDALLSAIVEEYAPTSDTFDVKIRINDEIQSFPFRRLTDGKDWEDLQKEASEYALKMRPRKAGKAKVVAISPEMAKWSKGVGPEVFAQVYVITKLATVAAFQSQAGVMMMYRRVWPVFKSITQQIDLAMTNQTVESENADHEDEKKGSTPTEPTDGGSREAGGSTDGTTTT